MKFTLIADDDFSGKKITFEFEEDYIEDVLSGFEDFLKGAGYHYNGQLEIVEDTKNEVESIWNNSSFSSVVDDHINLTHAFPDMMSVDLNLSKGCGSAGCGNCGCESNAN